MVWLLFRKSVTPIPPIPPKTATRDTIPHNKLAALRDKANRLKGKELVVSSGPIAPASCSIIVVDTFALT
jgi:hypothetical protein